MENNLRKLYNTMLLIETKGENTKIMAESIRFVEQLITEESQKSSAPAETTVEETKED